jgi:hypothetical protein
LALMSYLQLIIHASNKNILNLMNELNWTSLALKRFGRANLSST